MPRLRQLLSLLITLALLLGASAEAAPPQWQWVNPRPQGIDLLAVTYGAGRFVAVGKHGAILTSTDGSEWSARAPATVMTLYGVSYGNGTFVAVGGDPERGTQVLLSSPDGLDWSLLSAGEGVPLAAVTFGGGRFVAVGAPCGSLAGANGAAILTSPDGLNWKATTRTETPRLCSVTYGNGQFVAAGSGQNAVLSSADGLTWRVTARSSVGAQADRSVAYGAGRFLLTQPGGELVHSADGLSWSSGQPLPGAVAYAGEHFFQVGSALIASRDGTNWQAEGEPLGFSLRAVAHGGGRYVAVGDGGRILSSGDALDWQEISAGPSHAVNALTYGGGRYVAVGELGAVIVSENGIDWRLQTAEPQVAEAPTLHAVAHGAGRFVAVGEPYGLLYSSTDGLIWQQREPSAANYGYAAVLYTGERFVAVGDAGSLSSPDGLSWRQGTVPSGVSLRAVSHGNGRLVAVGINEERDGVILSSVDGLTWQQVHRQPGALLTSVTYGSGRFVAGDARGSTLTSVDGLRWRSGAAVALRQIIYGDGLFLGLAQQGQKRFYASRDGLTWSDHPTPAPVRSLAYANGKHFAVGDRGVILTLPPLCRSFADLSAAAPACKAVSALAERSILNGYPDGTFRPDGPVSRAEVAKLLSLTVGRAPQPNGKLPFRDTAGHWAAAQGYIQAAVALQAFSGYTDGTFRPDAPVTRAELVKIAAAAAGLAPDGLPDYSDIPANAWFAPWVAAAANARLIGPRAPVPLFTAEQFDPLVPATRAEAAILLLNLRPGS